MIRMIMASVGIILPVIAIQMIFKQWQTGAETGLFLIYALQMDILSESVFIIANDFQM